MEAGCTMDFDDAPTEATFRAEVRSWLAANAEPRSGEEDVTGVGIFSEQAAHGDEGVERARAWQRTLDEGGWAAPSWPVEHGGRGCSLTELLILGEELAQYRVPARIFEIGLSMLGPTIIAHGTAEQKARYLEPMRRGDEIWCQLWSEPGAGSDLAGLRATALRDPGTGDPATADFVLNGQKVWTSGAHYSRFGLGIFRSNPDVPKHKGITCLIVDMTAPGIEVRPLRQMTGGAHFNEVFFDDVHVPAANVVGEVDGGWAVARTTMVFERMAASGMNPPSQAVPRLVALAKRLPRGGGVVADDPAVRQHLAELHIRARAFDLTTARVRTALSQGTMPGPESSVLKLAAAELSTRMADTAMEVLGARGLLAGEDAGEQLGWIEAFLGAPALRIGGGTDEIQRSIIGEQVLGLPREPAVDRDVPFRELPSRHPAATST
jgi:alkylation response protein AidB-like acyl-CoA dehydrogenase